MKKNAFFIFSLFIALLQMQVVCGQGKANDISVNKLPQEIRLVLEEYVNILSNSDDLEACAEKFKQIAGGGLIDEDAENISLRSSTKPYALKKDFENVKFYANPLQITRINVSPARSSGFGESAITGKIYKIWIAKKKDVAGLPSPVSIMLPENHLKIKSPKVINIGSL